MFLLTNHIVVMLIVDKLLSVVVTTSVRKKLLS